MTSREINPAERMADAFERANTMTFTVVAELRCALTHAEIESALRKLEKRHPLLRVQVVRDGDEIAFAHGEGVAIPLSIETLPDEANYEARLQALAAKSIEHRAWPDAGPRAELTWLRMGDERHALLFSFHHLVSDGSSGMFAMRDLIGFLATPDEIPEPLESPGLHAFLPQGHGGLADIARVIAMEGRAMTGPKPQRVRAGECVPSERVALLAAMELSELDSARLLARARRDGATAHGVLCAGLSLAVAAEQGGAMQQRITHPVDCRRYLRSRSPDLRAIGDRVGYHVSSVDTDHRLQASTSLSALAAEITAQVRRKKDQGDPLLNAPVAGPLVVRLTRRMTSERFCKLAERELMLATHSVTNLGPLESLGLRQDVGELVVDNVWFVAAGTVLSSLGGAATSFGGRIRFNLTAASPLVPAAVFERIVGRVRGHLADYAQQTA